jgi:hypothetical protein
MTTEAMAPYRAQGLIKRQVRNAAFDAHKLLADAILSDAADSDRRRALFTARALWTALDAICQPVEYYEGMPEVMDAFRYLGVNMLRLYDDVQAARSDRQGCKDADDVEWVEGRVATALEEVERGRRTLVSYQYLWNQSDAQDDRLNAMSDAEYARYEETHSPLSEFEKGVRNTIADNRRQGN